MVSDLKVLVVKVLVHGLGGSRFRRFMVYALEFQVQDFGLLTETEQECLKNVDQVLGFGSIGVRWIKILPMSTKQRHFTPSSYLLLSSLKSSNSKVYGP